MDSSVHCEVTRLQRMGMKVEPLHEQILPPIPVQVSPSPWAPHWGLTPMIYEGI